MTFCAVCYNNSQRSTLSSHSLNHYPYNNDDGDDDSDSDEEININS